MAGFATLDTVLSQNDYNANLAKLQLHNQLQHGKGVLSGLELSDGGGLSLDISAGKLLAGAVEDLAATSVTLGANDEVYIFRNASGGVTTAAVATDPGGTMVCLGYVETDADSITLVSETGRMFLPQMTEARVWKVGGGVVVVDSDQKIGFFGATPIVKPTVADPDALASSPPPPAGPAYEFTRDSSTDAGAGYVEADFQAALNDIGTLGTALENLDARVAAIENNADTYNDLAELRTSMVSALSTLRTLGLFG